VIKLSALREHPRKPGRYEIALDASGVAAEPGDTPTPSKLIVSVELIAELKLKPGRVLSAAELDRLQSAAAQIACYDKALATLGARARSSADLRRYLKTKEFTDEQIAPVIEKLTALGLLDDLEYARTFARARMNPSRGLGPRRVAADLARKGVPRELAEQALKELAEERSQRDEELVAQGETPTSAVEEAAAKKLKSLSKLEPEVRKRRLFGFLARRGFSGAEISAVLRKLS
jgi:regulatory protein